MTDTVALDRRPLLIDSGRLRRGAELGVERLGPRQFRVQGQRHPSYDVDLDGDPPCTCDDWLWRGERTPCKHLCAALLQERDPRVMSVYVALLEAEVRLGRALGR